MNDQPDDADFKTFVRRSIVAAALSPGFFLITLSTMLVPVNVLNTNQIFVLLMFLGILAGILSCLIWMFVFGRGLYRFGQRGLWLLYEAPFGLFGFGWLAWVVIRCWGNRCAWP